MTLDNEKPYYLKRLRELLLVNILVAFTLGIMLVAGTMPDSTWGLRAFFCFFMALFLFCSYQSCKDFKKKFKNYKLEVVKC